MSLELVRLTPEQFEEGVDFINLVFSQNSVPHDFKKLTPRWTRPELASLNVAAIRDGRIRSLVMASPAEIHLAGRTLKGFGIGNVSTHLDERKTGLMRQVMTKTIEDMQAEGADLAFLGGYRQRYQYYGFERCGLGYACHVLERNVRHVLKAAPDYRFRKLEGVNDPAFAKIKELYNAQKLTVNRGNDEDFWLTLNMWRCTPYVCEDAAGNFIGHLCVSLDNQSFSEMLAVNDVDCVGMMHAWIVTKEVKEVSVYLNPWRRDLIRAIQRMAESLSEGYDHMYRIFHWDKVVDAFMALKAEYAPLADGKAVLKIGDWGKLSVSVKDGVPTVCRTEEKEDIVFTEFEACAVVFGPLAPSATADLPADLELLFDQWFPLPLSWHRQDCV